MNTTEYMKSAMVTEPLDFDAVTQRIVQRKALRLFHASIGIETESGEIADALKKHIFYGKPIDRVNLIEEAGDVLWYLAVLLNAVDSTFDEAMDKNIAKLKARFGDKFTEAAALDRNLEAERATLEAAR